MSTVFEYAVVPWAMTSYFADEQKSAKLKSANFQTVATAKWNEDAVK